MKYFKNAVLILAFFTFEESNTQAQNFSYSLSNTTDNYTELVSPTNLSNGSDWKHTSFKIPIGFSFPCLGQNFDSLRIEPNGFITFDKKSNYALATYKGLSCKQDSSQNWSTLSYLLSGGILKIQYKNLGFTNDGTELFNYQVWMYTNGNIEIHTGPNPTATYITNDQTTLLGLVNMNQDTNTKAYLASGSPDSPTGSSISINDPLLYLFPIPSDGKVFTFIHQ